MERAIETTAVINADNQLILDEALPIIGPAKVRVIILLPEDTDIDDKTWNQAINSNPVFDFLNDSEEDIYSLTDGKPFNAKG